MNNWLHDMYGTFKEYKYSFPIFYTDKTGYLLIIHTATGITK